MAKLTERSKDIDGLAEMISSFADGSEESVNAIAGMANATDKDLKNMVANWQALQEQQKTVADKLAELETEFTATMDALQLELEAAVGDMDLSEQAAQSGKNTIQGFIDGSEDMLPAVEAAYARLANAAVAAIDAQLQIQSSSSAVSAEAGVSGNSVALTVSPTYNLSGAENASDIASVLREATAGLKGLVFEAIEEAGINTGRRAFA